MSLNNVHTAFVLAATDGKRMSPLTNYLPKVLLPIDDKPIIIHHLERLESCGIDHVVVTLEKRLGEMIKISIEKGFSGKMKVTFFTQQERGGLGYAILACNELVRCDSFVFFFADEFNKGGRIYQTIANGECGDFDGVLNVMKAPSKDRICGTATMDIDQEKKLITKYIEKPVSQQILSGMCTAGAGIFSSSLILTLKRFQSYPQMYINGEHSIGASIQNMIESGYAIGLIEEDASKHFHFTTIQNFWNP